MARTSSDSTKGLYDDPKVLAWVWDEFESRWPSAAKDVHDPLSPFHLQSACLWRGFKDGVEFAYMAELEHLYSARRGGDQTCGA